MSSENPYKVRLTNVKNMSEKVIFSATPSVSESRSVEYQFIDPIHMPGSIAAYARTSSRTFDISDIKLISQTPKQASVNMQNLQLLRSWCLPRFGTGDSVASAQGELQKLKNVFNGEINSDVNDMLQQMAAEAASTKNANLTAYKQLGNPPPLLFFSAYSKESESQNTILQNINRIPVVIENLSINYPSDVDYIFNEDKVPFPTIMTISISLKETHSPKIYEKFSLDAFKSGLLTNF